MLPDLLIERDFALTSLNTFGIAARARAYVRIDSTAMLAAALAARRADAALAGLPLLLLGGGSNVLFTRDFNGTVLHMCMQGREVVGQRAGCTLVRAAAGEVWHDFVQWTLAQDLGGLESLSLIPGT